MAMYELLEEIEMSFDKSECTRYCIESTDRRGRYIHTYRYIYTYIHTYKWFDGPHKMSSECKPN